MGLGLVISEQIVTKFSGKIDFDSIPKKGSTFRFTFKLTPKSSHSPLLPNDLSRNYQVNSNTLVFEW